MKHESESARASLMKGFYYKDSRPRALLFGLSENAHAQGKCQLSAIRITFKNYLNNSEKIMDKKLQLF